MKTALLTLLMAIVISAPAISQNVSADSTAIIKTAMDDAEHFRINKADKRGVRKNLHNPNSDYFKPTAKYTSQQSLLRDSLYVQTFKGYALEKTRSRRTARTVIIVGGVIILMAATALFLVKLANGFEKI